MDHDGTDELVAQVREATAPFFYEAIIGQITAEEALNQMAAAAEAE